VSQRKRNTRRHRREPIRGTIYARERSPVTSQRELRVAEQGPEHLLPPGLDHLALGLGLLPLEAAPLYALVTAVYQAISSRPMYSSIVASSQLVRGLNYLGFDAELIPAYTMLRRANGQIIEIGVYGPSPNVSDDGGSDGHAVVWAESFNRCIDLGVCNNPALQRAFVDNEALTIPVVLPVPDGRDALINSSASIVTERRPFMMTWIFLPQWITLYEPLLRYHAPAIEHGGLAMAHVSVDLLSAVSVYQDIAQLAELYPRLGDLLSGRDRLPELDSYSSPIPHRPINTEIDSPNT
jgi:hypothetical protein